MLFPQVAGCADMSVIIILNTQNLLFLYARKVHSLEKGKKTKNGRHSAIKVLVEDAITTYTYPLKPVWYFSVWVYAKIYNQIILKAPNDQF